MDTTKKQAKVEVRGQSPFLTISRNLVPLTPWVSLLVPLTPPCLQSYPLWSLPITAARKILFKPKAGHLSFFNSVLAVLGSSRLHAGIP